MCGKIIIFRKCVEIFVHKIDDPWMVISLRDKR